MSKAPAPEGFCPNCWGYQKYDEQFVQLAEDKQIDINNKKSEATRAFIEEFEKKYLDGIKLKRQGDSWWCPHCQQTTKLV